MSNEINVEELERLAKAGTHPAPCARSCEANAYQIEVRRYQAEVEQFRADARRFRLAEKNLFDVQEAAKTIAKQAIAAEAERDTLAAKLKDAEHDRDEFRRVMNGFAEKMAELEGQEPVAWMTANREMTSFVNFHDDDLPLYARPAPAGPVNARLLEALSALLDDIEALIGESAGVYGLHLTGDASPWSELEEGGRFERLSSMSRAREAIAAAAAAHTEPVNARLLDVATGKTPHLYEGRCPDYVNGPESRDPDCPACQAIVSADAQQERLLQDMHDAGREIDRVMAEATPKAARLTDEEIASLLAASDKNSPRVPSFFMTEPHKFARAIETAVLRKNGIEVAE